MYMRTPLLHAHPASICDLRFYMRFPLLRQFPVYTVFVRYRTLSGVTRKMHGGALIHTHTQVYRDRRGARCYEHEAPQQVLPANETKLTVTRQYFAEIREFSTHLYSNSSAFEVLIAV
jgi:hypothetical protein